MARITVEDCLKRVDNRFKLVNAAARRVRQLREGSEYLVVSPKNEDIVVALREIAAGKVIVQQAAERQADVEAAEEELSVEAAEEGSAAAEVAAEAEGETEQAEENDTEN